MPPGTNPLRKVIDQRRLGWRQRIPKGSELSCRPSGAKPEGGPLITGFRWVTAQRDAPNPPYKIVYRIPFCVALYQGTFTERAADSPSTYTREVLSDSSVLSSGRTMRKVLPWPGVLSISIFPPSASTKL